MTWKNFDDVTPKDVEDWVKIFESKITAIKKFKWKKISETQLSTNAPLSYLLLPTERHDHHWWFFTHSLPFPVRTYKNKFSVHCIRSDGSAFDCLFRFHFCCFNFCLNSSSNFRAHKYKSCEKSIVRWGKCGDAVKNIYKYHLFLFYWIFNGFWWILHFFLG